MKHLLTVSSLDEKNIYELLNIADQLKFERRNKIKHPHLKGKTLGMLLNNLSSRTRVSLEVGMYDLGGHALMLPYASLSDGRGESIPDFAAVLTRFVDCAAIRTDRQKDAEAFAEGSCVPVINAATDFTNPCQALADLMTIREYKGSFTGRKLCYIGGGASSHAITVGAVKMGMSVTVACPDSHMPDKAVAEWAQENGSYRRRSDAVEAAEGADVVCTDVWSTPDDRGYTINDEVLSAAKSDVMVLHCLPVHRGEEITAEAFARHSGEIFDQTENRLHVQKAALIKLLLH